MTTHADPSASWAGDVVLADGGPVYVRPVRPDDAEVFRAFHERQSSDSIYYRYFSARPRLSDAELRRIVEVDGVERVALVAFEGEQLIGIASYDRWPGRDDAEVAFLIDDAHHGRGLATVLLEHLAVVAREHGIERFTAEVLADNRAMLSVFLKAGFPVQRAFDSGVIDVVFPLEPTPQLIDQIERREQLADARSLARLLFPRAVAVIGASDEPGTPGWALFRNLLDSGFPGPVHPVNPRRTHVASVACVPDVTQVEGPVDLALVAVPPAELHGVLEACAAKRVRGIVITTDVSTAEPPVDVPELVALAWRDWMRLIGPGSMGVLVTGDQPLPAHLAYLPSRSRGVPAGAVAVSLQGGPLGASVLDQARHLGIGLSTFVSLGDRADVSGNDLLQYVEGDRVTRVVAMYTETFGNPTKFARIARRVARTKPIVAVRAGAAHTEATDALYLQAGVVPVASVRELLDTARVLATQPLPTGRRIAVISNSRNPATLAVDALGRAGLAPARLGDGTWRDLVDGLHHARRVGEVVDLTWRAVPADYQHALACVAADEDVDGVLVIHAPPVPAAVEAPAEVIDRAGREGRIPIIAVALGHDEGPVLPGSPVPSFAFPEPAVAVLGRAAALVEWRAGAAAEHDDEPPPADLVAADAVVRAALEARPTGTLLPLAAVQQLLRAHGLDATEARAVTAVDAAVAAAADIGFPVALKTMGLPRRGRGVTGGVMLDLHHADEVRSAWAAMDEVLAPNGLREAMVQRMVPAGVEVRIDVEVDPALGPIVAVGLGGVHAAAIADRQVRLAPFGRHAAADLVAMSRAADALATLGIPADALVETVHRVAYLADQHPEIDRLDLNPILVSEAGAGITDAVVHVRPAEAMPADVPVRRL